MEGPHALLAIFCFSSRSRHKRRRSITWDGTWVLVSFILKTAYESNPGFLGCCQPSTGSVSAQQYHMRVGIMLRPCRTRHSMVTRTPAIVLYSSYCGVSFPNIVPVAVAVRMYSVIVVAFCRQFSHLHYNQVHLFTIVTFFVVSFLLYTIIKLI